MQTLLTAEQIAERVRVLGEQISRDFQGRPLMVIGVLLFRPEGLLPRPVRPRSCPKTSAG